MFKDNTGSFGVVLKIPVLSRSRGIECRGPGNELRAAQIRLIGAGRHGAGRRHSQDAFYASAYIIFELI